MKVDTKYVVYEFNEVMGSDRHLALNPVEFRGFVSNWFDTEEEAIQALIDGNKQYENFVILKQVRLCQE
jgi:hypothetical protein